MIFIIREKSHQQTDKNPTRISSKRKGRVGEKGRWRWGKGGGDGDGDGEELCEAWAVSLHFWKYPIV